MRRIAALAVAVIMLSVCALTAYGYTVTEYDMSSDHLSAVVNSGGMYLVSFSGGDVHAERVAPYGAYADLSLRYTAAAASLCGDTLVALCNDFDNDQLLVYTYDIYDDISDGFAIKGRRVNYNIGFCYDGSALWLPDENNNTVVNRFSSSGVLLNSHNFGNSATVISGYSNECFVISGRSLYRASADGYIAISGAELSTPARMISDDVIADSRGRIYRISGSGASLIAEVDCGGFCSAAISDSGELYYACSGTVYRYDVASARNTAYIDVGGDITALYYTDGRLYAGSGTEVYRISPDELTVYPAASTSADGHTGSYTSGISSGVYRVDTDSYRISRIDSPSTFAQFKQNMSYDGYKAALYRGGKKLDSGKVGTAMTVVFSGSDTYTFELSVVGDLTGEGNVNSRDVGELADYFLGNISFDGVYTLAADINDDGKVDIVDFALMCREAG